MSGVSPRRVRAEPPLVRPLTLRQIRLKLVWLLILPFFWFARPTPRLLLVGGVLAVVGLAIRAWSAGSIRKDRVLATGGPYAYTRNPLYLGSFLLGLGAVAAGGLWIFAVLFVVFFWSVYGAAMREEAGGLTERFGDAYRDYAAEVPLFLPRLTRYVGAEGSGFEPAQYMRNREWEALLGLMAAFALLFAKYWFQIH